MLFLVAGAVIAKAAFTVEFKTITSSLTETRDVSQSTVIAAPEPTFGGAIDKNMARSTAAYEGIQ